MPLKAYDCSKPSLIQCESIPMSNRLRKSDFYQVELDLIIIGIMRFEHYRILTTMRFY